MGSWVLSGLGNQGSRTRTMKWHAGMKPARDKLPVTGVHKSRRFVQRGAVEASSRGRAGWLLSWSVTHPAREGLHVARGWVGSCAGTTSGLCSLLGLPGFGVCVVWFVLCCVSPGVGCTWRVAFGKG